MNKQDFVELLDEELGLTLDPSDLDRPLDELDAWDSMQLLRLLSVIEARTKVKLSVPALLEARTLGAIRELATP